MFQRNITNLREIDADIINSNIYNGIYINNIENYILGITENVINNYNYLQTEINTLTITSNYINTDLQNSKNNICFF